jgi:hypothetical protein
MSWPVVKCPLASLLKAGPLANAQFHVLVIVYWILALQDTIDDVRRNVEPYAPPGIIGPEHTTQNHIIPVLAARDRFATCKQLIKY